MRPLALVFSTVILAACASPAPSWTEPFHDADRMILSVWGDPGGDRFFAGGSLGGSAPGLALRWDGAGFADLHAPTPQTLWWVFGLSARNLWFVGEHGTILHYDGAAFTAEASGTDANLYGCWGAADDDVWAVGGVPDSSSVVLHWDGAAWRSVADPPQNGAAYFKVWGSSAHDVFIVGQLGRIFHYDGGAWTAQDGGVGARVTLLTVAGRAANDVYAVGGQGVAAAIHYDGNAWSPVAGLRLDESSGLAGVAVDAAGDLSITGLGGAKLRRAGASWTDDSLLAPESDLHGTWLDGSDDIFAVGGDLNAPAGAPRNGVIAHYGAPLP